MDGLIAVVKPQGLTSHDVVHRLRRCLRERRVGHFGTLDPLATGLLLVAVGRATRLFPFYSRTDKVYRGCLRLGLTTDTFDALGHPTQPERQDLPSRDDLGLFMDRMTGPSLQTPPAFSAKKVRGQPSYKLARGRIPVELAPQKIIIHAFELNDYRPPWADFEVSCSAGTYVRSLVHDLGQALGCGAYLESLTRLSSGEFRLHQALSIAEVEDLAGRGEYSRFLLPLESLLPSFPKLQLKEAGRRAARTGSALQPAHLEDFPPADAPCGGAEGGGDTVYRIFDPDGKLTALARRRAEGEALHPFLVLD